MEIFRHYKRSFRLLDSKTKLVALITTILLSIVSMLDLVGIGLIFPIAKLLSGDADFLAVEAVQFTLNLFSVSSATALATDLAIVLVGILVTKAVVSTSIIYWTTKKITLAEGRFMGRLYRAYLRAPIEYHHQHNSSEFLRNINTSVVSLFRTTLLTTSQAISGVMLSIGILTVLIYTDPLAAFTCFAVLGGGGVLYSTVTSARITNMAQDMHVLNAENYKTMIESLGSITDIKALDKHSFFLSKFMKIRMRILRLSHVHQVIQILPRYISEVLVGILMASVILILVKSGRTGEDIIAVLALYGIASMRLLPIINSIVSTVNAARLSIPAVKQLDVDVKLFGEEIVKDRPWSEEQVQPDLSKITSSMNQSIHVRDVFHEYSERSTALKGVSLVIDRGSSVGLVGRSGAGKTTLVNILLGLIEPTSGDVLVDGISCDMSVSAIHRSIGHVPQHIFLLDDSIRRNIAFGVDDENINSDAIMAALEKAQLLDFVNGLPDTVNTMVGEKGVRLSGGQRQRIGIARALYNDPEILIFDEATSALDVETESQISKVMDDLKGEKTMIIIAHRLSTIKNCDMIVFMKDGVIENTGSFDELQSKNEGFRALIKYSLLSH